MAIGISNFNKYSNNIINNLSNSKNVKNISTEERADAYFKSLQKEYSKIDLKRNDRNIDSRSGVSITLSPDLIKKALKDPEIDKKIRKSLDDLVKNKNLFKAYSCTKDGQEVKSVSFFIDGREKTSCNIKLKNNTTLDEKTKEEKRTISIMIEKQVQKFTKKINPENSLYYKYMKLLSEDKFTSIDVTI